MTARSATHLVAAHARRRAAARRAAPARPVRLGACLAVAAALLAGCRMSSPAERETGGEPSAPQATAVGAGPAADDAPAAGAAWAASRVPEDTVVLLGNIDPTSLDPAWMYEVAGAGIAQSVYSTLVAFEHLRADAFVPALATEWSVSEDGLAYTFAIREGVAFHEGGTLEPHDVAYTLQRGMLQDRSGGPMWLYQAPILGTTGMVALARRAGGQDGAAGDPPALDELADGAREAACLAVQSAVTADDEAGTVTVRLAQRTPWFLQLVAMPYASILDREWMIEQGDWDGECVGWERWHDPAAEETPLFDRANGTGPYRLGTWAKNESITLEAWDGYWRDTPAWDGGPSGPARVRHIVVENVPEWGTRFARLQAGEADTAYVPLAEIDQVAPMVHEERVGSFADPAVEVLDPAGILTLYRGYPVANASAITFNFDIATAGGNDLVGSGALDGDGIPADFFADLDVRRAFVQCFDTDAFIRDAMRGDAIPARGPIIAGLDGYRPDSPVTPFDIDACRESLARAHDGAVAQDGFRIVAPYAEGWAESEIALAILADGLSRADARYRIEPVQMPWPTLLENIAAGRLPLAMTGWAEDYHDASNWVFTYLHRDGANSGPQNFPADLAATLDPLVEAAAVEADPAKRDALYAALQQLAVDHATAIFINQGMGRAYWRREVQGAYAHPLLPGIDFYHLSKTPAP